jgi:5-methylcytosine-specific restriction endonuclease McrA
MKKADRQKIFEKYGGRCAYCGCDLDGKRWNVDHIEPVNRVTKTKPGYYVHKVTKERTEYPKGSWWLEWDRVEPKQVFDKMLNPERDTLENSNPSCHSCNITKSSMSIGQFKEWIQTTTKRLNTANYNNYKFGKRYGLIQETGIEVKFYFETVKQKQ